MRKGAESSRIHTFDRWTRSISRPGHFHTCESVHTTNYSQIDWSGPTAVLDMTEKKHSQRS
jgi:hypothetical protein